MGQFNRAMRMKANVMGYSLNQRGLFGGVVRKPQDRRIKYSEGKHIFIVILITVLELLARHTGGIGDGGGDI